MRVAAESIHNNQLARAGAAQRQSIEAMAGVAELLEEKRQEELDRLVKQLKEAEQKLESPSATKRGCQRNGFQPTPRICYLRTWAPPESGLVAQRLAV